MAVQAALKSGANPNARTLDVPDTRVLPVGMSSDDEKIDSTPLMLCIKHADDPTPLTRTIKGTNGHTYLMLDDLTLLKTLLDSGADPNVPGQIATNMEDYPLTLAIWRHRNIEFLGLLIRYGSKINQRDMGRETPLHLAAVVNYPEAIELLLNHGADIMALSNGRETPLHSACRSLHIASIETLLRHHAFVNARDSQGKTPLDYALTESDKWILVEDRFKSSQLQYNADRRMKIAPILRKAGAKTAKELDAEQIH
jgi:ankyrin repeat protein